MGKGAGSGKGKGDPRHGHRGDPKHGQKAEPAQEPKAESAQEPKAEPAQEPKADSAQEPKAESAQEPKQEPKAEPAQEPKQEPKAEPAQEPKQEPKAEPAQEPKQEPKADSKQGPPAAGGAKAAESAAQGEEGGGLGWRGALILGLIVLIGYQVYLIATRTAGSPRPGLVRQPTAGGGMPGPSGLPPSPGQAAAVGAEGLSGGYPVSLVLASLVKVNQGPTALTKEQIPKIKTVLTSGPLQEPDTDPLNYSLRIEACLKPEQVAAMRQSLTKPPGPEPSGQPGSREPKGRALIEALAAKAGLQPSGIPTMTTTPLAASATARPLAYAGLLSGLGALERDASLALTPEQASQVLPILKAYVDAKEDGLKRLDELLALLTDEQRSAMKQNADEMSRPPSPGATPPSPGAQAATTEQVLKSLGQ